MRISGGDKACQVQNRGCDTDRLFINVRLSLSVISALDSLVGVTKATPRFCEGPQVRSIAVLVAKTDDGEGCLGGSVG